MNKLKAIGWTISLVGIIIGFGDYLGWFEHKERIDFYNLIIDPRQPIPINHPALREFVKAFPPPKGYNNVQLNKTTLQTHNGFAISGTIRYVNIESKNEHDIATFEDVKSWAKTDNVNLYSLGIVLLGWIIGVIIDITGWAKRSVLHLND